MAIGCGLGVIILDKQQKLSKESLQDKLDRQLTGQDPAHFMSLRDSPWENKKKVRIDDYSLLDGERAIGKDGQHESQPWPQIIRPF